MSYKTLPSLFITSRSFIPRMQRVRLMAAACLLSEWKHALEAGFLNSLAAGRLWRSFHAKYFIVANALTCSNHGWTHMSSTLEKIGTGILSNLQQFPSKNNKHEHYRNHLFAEQSFDGHIGCYAPTFCQATGPHTCSSTFIFG